MVQADDRLGFGVATNRSRHAHDRRYALFVTSRSRAVAARFDSPDII
jgi:hypothetical protein